MNNGMTTNNPNLIKLRKMEKKVLIALLQPNKTEYNYPKEGNDMKGIAEIVYGQKVLNCERIGEHYCENLSVCYSAKSYLSNILNELFRKGLVKKCSPNYHYYWQKKDEFESDSTGSWRKELKGLQARWYESTSGQFIIGNISLDRWTRLPTNTKFWWILTDKGKEIAGTGLRERNANK